MVNPICFMVMPFGKKATGVAAEGVPPTIDFDSLWFNALQPALAELEYDPVRADQDTSALIIQEMLERLAGSDLIVADLSIPNGNVYYEVGFRHALREAGCVLISAEWSKPLFDMAQLRRLTYPLKNAVVAGDEAKAIHDILVANLPAMAKAQGPAFQSIPGFPKIDATKLGAFRDYVRQLSEFQASVNAIRRMSDADDESKKARKKAAEDLVERHRKSKSPAVVLELLYLTRDLVGFAEVEAFIDQLPQDIQDSSVVREQRYLAIGKQKQKLDQAIGALEELVKTSGSTPEREGLLGGRYKDRHGQKKSPADLDAAIEHYERGMQLDLNEYFCSSNLPRLLRLRNDPGDEEKARAVAYAVRLACERAKALGTGDEWLNPTLLGSAFDAGDLPAIAALTAVIRREGHVAWKLETMIADIEQRSIPLHADAALRAELTAALEKLKALVR